MIYLQYEAIREALSQGDRSAIDSKCDDVRACATVADWLTWPSALGELPDRMRLMDRRRLPWPSAGKDAEVRLFEYGRDDPAGLDPPVLGTAIFREGELPPPPMGLPTLVRPLEDVYAVHAFFGSGWNWKILGRNESRRYESGLPSACGGRMVACATVSDSDGREFVMARGAIDGADGDLVFGLGGAVWYPASELPIDPAPAGRGIAALAIHVGRLAIGCGVHGVNRERLPGAAPVDEGSLVANFERAHGALLAMPAECRFSRLEGTSLARAVGRYVRVPGVASSGKAVRIMGEWWRWAPSNAMASRLCQAAAGAGLWCEAVLYGERLLAGYPKAYRSAAVPALVRSYMELGRSLEAVELARRCTVFLEGELDHQKGWDYWRCMQQKLNLTQLIDHVPPHR